VPAIYRQAQLSDTESATLAAAVSGTHVESALQALRAELKTRRDTTLRAAKLATLTAEQARKARAEVTARLQLLEALPADGLDDAREHHRAALRVLDDVGAALGDTPA
jgi:hypothetical protein